MKYTTFEALELESESLRQQLSDSQKQVTLLRGALEYHQSQTRPIHKTIEALSATADMSGLIVCHAEPVGWCGTSGVGEFIVSKSKVWNFLTTPLYRAWEPK